MSAYVPIFLFTLLAISFPLLTLTATRLIRAHKVSQVKLEPYECGVEPTSFAFDTRFSIRYYLIAVLFVVFDVETIFLFPWAILIDKLALFGIVEMLVFLAILMIGYWYVWKREALNWV